MIELKHPDGSPRPPGQIISDPGMPTEAVIGLRWMLHHPDRAYAERMPGKPGFYQIITPRRTVTNLPADLIGVMLRIGLVNPDVEDLHKAVGNPAFLADPKNSGWRKYLPRP